MRVRAYVCKRDAYRCRAPPTARGRQSQRKPRVIFEAESLLSHDIAIG